KMFNDTWLWAGTFRTHQTNIGVLFHLIPESLKILCDEASYWLQNHVFSLDEIAVRFHHRLVEIHAFPNGNGRHARLMAEGLLFQFNIPRFNWGSRNLAETSEVRTRYIKALKQ